MIRLSYMFRRHRRALYVQRRCLSVKQLQQEETLAENVRRLRPPINQPLPGISSSSTKFTVPEKDVYVTTLKSGLSVASQRSFGQYSSIGLFVKLGSAYEGGFTSGISQVLEKVSFLGSSKYPSNADLLAALEQYGGTVDCMVHRDLLAMSVSVLCDGVEKAVEVLADAALRPLLSAESVEAARMTVRFLLQDLSLQQMQDQRLTDLIHQAALGLQGCGRPLLCPEENISKISSEELASYLNAYMRPERMTLAALNVPHDFLVDCAQKSLEGQTVSFSELGQVRQPKADEEFVYKGGVLLDHRNELDRLKVFSNQLPDLAHYAIGFEAVPFLHEDCIATFVLNMLIGGGTSFSAGGPGKGLFTRLYANVLCRYPFVYSAMAVYHAYTNGGLFVVMGSCPPPKVDKLADVLADELRLFRKRFYDEEVMQAKNRLLGMLFSSIELRGLALEDIGRQIAMYGKHVSAEELRGKILKVTTADVSRVACKLLESPPSVAALGNLSALPKDNLLPNFNKRKFFG